VAAEVEDAAAVVAVDGAAVDPAQPMMYKGLHQV
jgi:hypothetical protein